MLHNQRCAFLCSRRTTMPPKFKYTREQILDAAVELTREQGINSVMARSLGAKLGISSRPIFSAFENMDEVKKEVIIRARSILIEYLSDYADYYPSFKRYGMQIISFAQHEPKLFELLFMKNDSLGESFDDILTSVMGNFSDVLEVVKKDYSLNDEQAEKLYKHLWIKTFGISVMCAKNACKFTESELSEFLSETFVGIMSVIRSEKLQEIVKKSAVKKIK